MRSRSWIALLAVTGAAIAIAVTAWPAAAKQRKPLAMHTAPPLQLAVARTLPGVYDPHYFDLSQLIPRGSRISEVWYPPARRYRQQVLVEWTERHRHFRWGHLTPRPFRWGLTLWSYTGSHWRAVKIPVVRWAPPDGNEVRISFADVTEDGRPDLLFEQDPMTNHGCEPHQIFSTSPRDVTRRVFSSFLCETTLAGDHGLLGLDMPYYIRNNAMCCPSFIEHLRLRWDGRRFVRASLHIDKTGPYSTG
jgi:hypothetical protein